MPDDFSLAFRFELKWLIGPLAIILAAVALIYFFPTIETTPPIIPLPPQPIVVAIPVDVAAAREQAQLHCAQTYNCSSQDCLEKLLTHVDSATVSIEAILRTPAPKEFRDRLRLAIARGVTVRLVLDASLNPTFFLEGAIIRVKPVSRFVTTNFLMADRTTVVFGTDPQLFAIEPDVIRVACDENERTPYEALFDRVWGNESTAFSSESTQEETLSDNELLLPDLSASCSESSCGEDTYFCDGTTKVWQNYYCENSCTYSIIPLYFSQECGY
ncbi:MAG: hypothetical protein AABY11_00790, partial [archaeon]